MGLSQIRISKYLRRLFSLLKNGQRKSLKKREIRITKRGSTDLVFVSLHYISYVFAFWIVGATVKLFSRIRAFRRGS